MSAGVFHPVITRWFTQRFGEPTAAQARGWEAIRSSRHTLIAAPTGSGKTLAAFLAAIDDLLREGLETGGLPDEVRVVYVSPLKALSADIHRNLAEPRREIRQLAEAMGLAGVKITAAVRTGDTPQAERAAMLRTPPHILVTTPESLYLLLTAERSREMLRTARVVIVDEIHAVLESRRGAHLALTLERLDHVVGRRLQRIGLSATQKPIQEVARFLVGGTGRRDALQGCIVVDEGHVRELDLGLELPGSPLQAVMSAETWQEVYERLVRLIEEHRTTLVFVNTRRLAERVARALSERLGEDAVTAHHGSLAREVRLEAEERLKSGRLRALVATASLELGIDIGYVDLVCQLGTPRRIATFLQRVGRSGHTVRGTPKGRLFPLTRDELIECAALLGCVRRGELDGVIIPEKPLDVLAQQMVAEAACQDWAEDDLFALFRGAYPYRDLERREFDDVLLMLARGFSTRRGRRGALVHHDAVNRRLRGRKGARLTAITCGGAIPELADYRVLLEPEGLFIGTLNEDFAIESMPGDVFQLGNTSWRIVRIQTGVVRVEDAHGQPPGIPFWLGEAPARSAELSAAVAEIRREVETRLGNEFSAGEEANTESGTGTRRRTRTRKAVEDWLEFQLGLSGAAAQQIVEYLAETKRLLGVIPTQETVVLERFFDESGGMQLVLHSPFGSRLNRAWGLALRKRFCRKFNFELQAAATDEGLLLSLGPQHSFPLEEVFAYLQPEGVREILVQAVLDAPVFQTRWRWNTTVALAVPRSRGGVKVAPQLQRMMAEDLLAAVFPDAAACLENVTGDREVPDHPLVSQALKDCLQEAMDLPQLVHVLEKIRAGVVQCVARDTPEPSPLCHEILNARPYAFLDDAPLEERRAQAVYTRRALEPSSAAELGALDAAAIARVRDEAWPQVDSADELHDALLTCGFLTAAEGEAGREGVSWRGYFGELVEAGRALAIRGSGPGRGSAAAEPPLGRGSDMPATISGTGTGTGTKSSAPDAAGFPAVWAATERLGEVRAVWPEAVLQGSDAALSLSAAAWERADAIRELLRGRLEVLGPTPAAELAESLGVEEGEAEAALVALEAEGVVLRGSFTPGTTQREWCERRLLARIHRYTLNRLRAEIEPVSAADFMRFLVQWQRVEPGQRVSGLDGLSAVLEQLNGFELPAAAWEADLLPSRCENYTPELLDALCLMGRVAWGRLSPPAPAATEGAAGGGPASLGLAADGARAGGGPRRLRRAPGPLRTSPIALFTRRNAAAWLEVARPGHLSTYASQVMEALERRGASFFEELASESGLLPTQVELALAELAALGLVTSDSFAGLRALLTPPDRRRPVGGARARRSVSPYGVETAGRWSLLASRRSDAAAGADNGRRWGAAAVELAARTLLRRYGIVFRRLLVREATAPPWRELVLSYRRLEARGEIRGGRFLAGISGEQFALPEAVGSLRAVRKQRPDGRLLAISAADPLNLVGILTPGERVPALAGNRILFRDGVPIAVREAGTSRRLTPDPTLTDRDLEHAIARRGVSPLLRAYLRPAG